MRLETIILTRHPTLNKFTGKGNFSNTNGDVTVDLDQAIVDEMLLVYDKAISGVAQRIADALVADSVSRKNAGSR